jgi:hypothetical protein
MWIRIRYRIRIRNTGHLVPSPKHLHQAVRVYVRVLSRYMVLFKPPPPPS